MSDFKKGDSVSWDSSAGTTQGKVIKKVTEPTSVKGYTAKASKDHPEYLVKSDKTGKTAIHLAKELKKL